MPKISKNKLDSRISRLILEQLIVAFQSLNKKDEVGRLFRSLFTKTEQIMLAKRLATAMLLEQGESYAVISNTLKISNATISFVRQAILNEDQEYVDLIKMLNKLVGDFKL